MEKPQKSIGDPLVNKQKFAKMAIEIVDLSMNKWCVLP